ncbi:hypothetical protein ACFL6U_04150 [Planctomycetota bacterium]
MTPRERLQLIYELAFYPPRIHLYWNELRRNMNFDRNEVGDLLGGALSLHLALPEKGFQSQRALKRVARYQASAKAFGTESFIKNIAKQLGLDILPKTDKIPPGMIRDLKLPEFSRREKRRRRVSNQ